MAHLGTMELVENLGTGRLSQAINSTQTIIDLAGGDGNNFPAILGSGDIFHLTITDATAETEIVKVTATSGDTFMVVRGQDGTLARAWAAGAVVACRVTASMLQHFLQKGEYDIVYDPAVPCTAGHYGYNPDTKKWYLCPDTETAWEAWQMPFWYDATYEEDAGSDYEWSLSDPAWNADGSVCLVGQCVVGTSRAARVKKSLDGGFTWDTGVGVGGASTTARVSSIVNVTGQVWVCCRYEYDGSTATDIGIYKSSDDGGTWTLKQTIANTEGLVQSGDIVSLGNDVLVMGASGKLAGSRLIWRSGDAGETWAAINDLVGAQEVWQLTVDGGGTVYALMLSMAGTPIYASTDNGQTWELRYSGDTLFYGLAAQSAGVVMGYDDDNQIIYKSIDGGVTFSPCAGFPLYPTGYFKHGDRICFASSDGDIFSPVMAPVVSTSDVGQSYKFEAWSDEPIVISAPVITYGSKTLLALSDGTSIYDDIEKTISRTNTFSVTGFDSTQMHGESLYVAYNLLSADEYAVFLLSAPSIDGSLSEVMSFHYPLGTDLSGLTFGPIVSSGNDVLTSRQNLVYRLITGDSKVIEPRLESPDVYLASTPKISQAGDLLLYYGHCLKVADNSLDKAFLYRSDDNGASWNEVEWVNGLIQKLFPVAGSRLIAIAYDSSMTTTSLLVSDDSGDTWNVVYEISSIKDLDYSYNSTTKNIYLFGGDVGSTGSGIVLFSSSNGSEWDEHVYSGQETSYPPFPDLHSLIMEGDDEIAYAKIYISGGY